MRVVPYDVRRGNTRIRSGSPQNRVLTDSIPVAADQDLLAGLSSLHALDSAVLNSSDRGIPRDSRGRRVNPKGYPLILIEMRNLHFRMIPSDYSCLVSAEPLALFREPINSCRCCVVFRRPAYPNFGADCFDTQGGVVYSNRLLALRPKTKIDIKLLLSMANRDCRVKFNSLKKALKTTKIA